MMARKRQVSSKKKKPRKPADLDSPRGVVTRPSFAETGYHTAENTLQTVQEVPVVKKGLRMVHLDSGAETREAERRRAAMHEELEARMGKPISNKKREKLGRHESQLRRLSTGFSGIIRAANQSKRKAA